VQGGSLACSSESNTAQSNHQQILIYLINVLLSWPNDGYQSVMYFLWLIKTSQNHSPLRQFLTFSRSSCRINIASSYLFSLSSSNPTIASRNVLNIYFEITELAKFIAFSVSYCTSYRNTEYCSTKFSLKGSWTNKADLAISIASSKIPCIFSSIESRL
jgi:hypothetical protein